MRKKKIGLIVLLLLVLASWATVSADPGVKMVPFKAQYDSGPADFSRSRDVCNEKGWGTAYFEVVGTATHLGKIEGTLTHCFDLQTGIYDEGEQTLTGANGDSIHMLYSGQFIGENYTVDCIIHGGTGRFENASGTCAGEGFFKNLTSYEFHTELNGLISSVGSSK